MSDRQLNQYEYHRLRVDRGRLLSQSYLWSYPIPAVLIGSAETFRLAWTVGSKPTIISRSTFSAVGDGAIVARLFEGGALSNGSIITGFALNRHDKGFTPIQSFLQSPDVDLGTPLIATFMFRETGLSDFNPMILQAGQTYSLDFTNVVLPNVAFSGSWNYIGTNDDPLAGEATHENKGKKLKFSTLDDVSADRHAELLSVPVGGFISTSDDVEWSVTKVTDHGAFVEYEVRPEFVAADGLYAFEFLIATPPVMLMEATFEFAALPPADLM